MLDTFKDLNDEMQSNPNAGMTEYDNDPLPEGEYSVCITESELRNCTGGERSTKPEKVQAYLADHPEVVAGVRLCMKAKIEGPTHVGRTVFFDFLLTAPSDQPTLGESFTPAAQEAAAKKDLMGLTKRCGLKAITNESVFVGMAIKLKCKVKRSKKGSPYNQWHFTVEDPNAAHRVKVNSTFPVAADDAPF